MTGKIIIHFVLLLAANLLFTACPNNRAAPRLTPWATSTPEPMQKTTTEPVPAAVTTSACKVNGVLIKGAVPDASAAIRDAFGASRVVTVSGACGLDSRLVVPSGHTLRLDHANIQPRTDVVPILLQSGSTLAGSSWETAVIDETTVPGQWGIVAAHDNNTLLQQGFTFVAVDSDITVRDIQLRASPKRTDFYSATQALSLGNCHGCKVERVWVYRTHSIGIQLGGLSQTGNYAADSYVKGCRFSSVASQALACVNCQNVQLTDNEFYNPGQAGGPGAASIDLEPNTTTDRLINVLVARNRIDARRHAYHGNGGNAIIVQAAGALAENLRGNVVENNEIIGGNNLPEAPVTNIIPNGIFISDVPGTVVRNNRIIRTGQQCMFIAAHGVKATGNYCEDTAGGGNPSVWLQNCAGCVLKENTFRYTKRGPTDPRILVEGDAAGLVIENNAGFELQRPK